MLSRLLLALSLAAAACSGPPTDASEPQLGDETTTTIRIAPDDTDVPEPLPVNQGERDFFQLAQATHTCAEFEANLPASVDDSGLVLEQGLLTLRWGDGESASLQVLDDKTCTADTQAWKLLIRPNLDADTLHRAGVLCRFNDALLQDASTLANAVTVMEELSTAEELCS